jgi:glycyl-tRNA synthetase beta chain
MATLLVEIGCEELPASACREAERQLPELVRRVLGVEPGRILVTPRRLTVLAEDVPAQTADQWMKGPPVAMRDKAAEGFAKRHGVSADELEERDGFLGVTVAGKPLAEVLPGQVDELVKSFVFPKTMRWDDSGIRFPRPVRWRLAMLDSTRIVGEGSYGHRFGPGRVEIGDAAGYVDALRAADVEPETEERRKAIVSGLDALGGWGDPNGVLAEVVYLAEKPIVIAGEFDERFLQLPARVIETTIQHHIRAFPLGANRFAFVANGGDPDTVRSGVENVVEGRLEDASFTFERDVKVGIDSLAERLGAITFFQGAGSFADKTERLAKLVEALGGGEAALEAARLAKADQASELVREFPELEGHVGAEYARIAGYPEAVSAAIDEQYLPDAADAPLPKTETGRVLSAADKIDTLNVSFGLGHRPTGSRDPYGLRRAAIGLDRLATEGNLAVPRELMDDEVAEFVEERFEGMLDAPVEYVRAARRASVRDLGGVARLAEALASLPAERFDPIHTAYTRASRLAEKEEGAAAQLEPALLVEPAEAEVAKALERVDPEIAAALEAGDFAAAVESGAELGPLLDRFFEDVLVLAEDSAVRANRLRLLLNVRDTLGRLGELSQIPR